MSKRPPQFKKSPSPRTGTGSATAFSDSKIKGVSTKGSSPGVAHREGFSKRVYTTNCGKGNLPKG